MRSAWTFGSLPRGVVLGHACGVDLAGDGLGYFRGHRRDRRELTARQKLSPLAGELFFLLGPQDRRAALHGGPVGMPAEAEADVFTAPVGGLEVQRDQMRIDGARPLAAGCTPRGFAIAFFMG